MSLNVSPRDLPEKVRGKQRERDAEREKKEGETKREYRLCVCCMGGCSTAGGETEGDRGEGKSQTRAILLKLFSSFLFPWKKPGEKKVTLDYIWIASQLRVPRVCSLDARRVYLRINAVVNLWISLQLKVWLFWTVTGALAMLDVRAASVGDHS